MVVNLDTPLCPDCKGNLIVRDSRNRKVKNSDGSETVLVIRRLYCAKCNRIHAELPDMVSAHKHYSNEAIKSAMEEMPVAADNRTLNRWRNDK